ncbi:MAG TPA: CvpA family protein [Verrucomicrobiae bacterium]|jgi:uncharacterized membrane protein required for colicin V production|nr:CvpA family protein [Verrucomicrobiae bacterium]
MIAVAANSASSFANNLSVSWFDAVFVIVLGFGLFRGRRNGLSRELLPMFQWIALTIVCGTGYPTVAQLCITYLKWGRTIADVTGYVVLALVIFGIFAVLKQLFTERLVKNDTFKSAEYYLGMPAGMVRFACMLLAALALVNAPVYTQQDIAIQKAKDKANFGGGMMNGSFFPSFNDVQDAIFKQSITGRYVKMNLGLLLIDPHRLDVKHLKPPPRSGS